MAGPGDESNANHCFMHAYMHMHKCIEQRMCAFRPGTHAAYAHTYIKGYQHIYMNRCVHSVLGQITSTHLARLGDEAKATFKVAQREHRVKNPPVKVNKKKEEKEESHVKVQKVYCVCVKCVCMCVRVCVCVCVCV
jgi:hypothetical protein